MGPGTRVCVHRSKRALVEVGDYVGCYFLDDRAAVTALLHAARLLRERGVRPVNDVYLAFTRNEEIGGVGGSYASGSLPGTLTLALEVGPTEREYGTTVGGGPIVGYSDALCVYDKDIADRLMRIANDRRFQPQAAVLGAFESDASHAKANGLTPRAGAVCVLFEAALEAGADDVVSNESGHEVYAAQDQYAAVAKALEAKFGEPRKAALVWRPQNTVAVGDEQGEKLLKLIENLNEHDDVQNVYANFEVSDALVQRMSA